MDNQVTPGVAQSSAVQAFEELRGEISLLRRAIEGLTVERRDQPDYGPTLEALVKSNEEIREWARRISERPALQLTPRKFGDQIEEEIARFREHDRQLVEGVQGQLLSAIGEVKAISARMRTSYEQARIVKIVGGVCLLGGFLLGLLLSKIDLLL